MSEMQVNLTGKISGVSRDGLCAVVALDTPYAGKRLAVISDETRGRIALMNKSQDGALKKETRVSITLVEIGDEALRVVQISAA